MTKGYIVCVWFKKTYTDCEDCIHSDTVYFTSAKALKDLKRMYEEQKSTLTQNMTEREKLTRDNFDERHGRFVLETEYAELFSYGAIHQINVDCDK